MTDAEILLAVHEEHEARDYASAGLPDVSACVAEWPLACDLWDGHHGDGTPDWQQLPNVVEARALYAEWAGV
jgi:hypothetical protein